MAQVSSFLSIELFQFGDSPVTVAQVLSVPIAILLVLGLARWAMSVLSKWMLSRGRNANLVQIVRRALWVVVLVSLVLAILGMLNVPLATFAFLSGALAIGIGFGAQNIINNFISGWILMGEQPIRVDDLLEIDGTLGRVETIGTRSTRICRLDSVRIVIPNSHLLENSVVNWTLTDQEIRTSVRVGVAYGSPVRKVAQLLEQAVREREDVLDDPEPRIIFDDFGDSSLVFEAFFFTLLRPGSNLRLLRSKIRFRIDELFRDNGIVIAFPQRDVHIDGTLHMSGPAEAGPNEG
jgi:small-conductance mechanosensitive channel